MKKLMVIIFLMISVNSQATQNKFQFDAGLNLLVSSAKGYKINDVISGSNYGVYLGAGYKIFISDDYYLLPAAHINVVKVTVAGKNTRTQQASDIYTLTTPYKFKVSLGGFHVGTLNLEPILGIQSIEYSVEKDFSHYTDKALASDKRQTALLYGFRLTKQKDKSSYSIELLTSQNSFSPVKNSDENWDINNTSLAFIYHF